VARQQKLAQQRAEEDERAQRALARAAAPAFQKHGKPAMLRSTLLKHEDAAGEAGAQEGQDRELEAYLQQLDLA
jgi:hypothetical protein